MLELDFTPRPGGEKKEGFKNLIIGILAFLLVGVSLLYVAQLLKAKKETTKIKTKVAEKKVVKAPAELDPRRFLLRGIVGKGEDVYIIMEGAKEKYYLMRSGDIIENWEFQYAGGDSVKVKSLITGESFYLRTGG